MADHTNRAAGTRFLAIVLLLTLGVGLAWTQESVAGKPDALQKFRAGSLEEARQICLAELADNPSNIESYVVLGWTLVAMQRYADAEIYATRAYNIRRDPRIIEILGEAFFFQGKNQEALNYFTMYINQLPDGARIGTAYQFVGEVYLRQDKLNHADIAMRTALQYEPNNARWWARLGFVRERLSDWQNGLEAYNAALRISPGMSDAQAGRDRVAARLRG
ncbi:MAG: hypothetical protein A2087_11545 [Spirochaetes bacterium GWD1_61_31]|nr:MAG: hypothetical protein A2Y37_14775 [Spirochaetes bacterium GWB1_60_80]OHD29327.1 MAG: hypothetical protein A2004_08275 [Spirochaetes bacterium GWC1_61_12]OHD35835.1 MAG: hypothetical protein A2087_11545 [Spirochaetes bacterium GWD1_61_31]OHD46776.1 MAG: hypothetical protein A2Y35_10715 [Spirochaetes bacterium GWE1_60_18]OHD61228.1 MAG: hypothetical protein A2Y32_13010 [Spirochaetes bacterium GWF1_60_12]HAP43014.1 hypothetical protein [Spirochaetaceae bacterium]